MKGKKRRVRIERIEREKERKRKRIRERKERIGKKKEGFEKAGAKRGEYR
jgi:hypothetical protein